MAVKLSKIILPLLKTRLAVKLPTSHIVFGINNVEEEPKPEQFSVESVQRADQESMVGLIKEHFLKHHAFVESRNMQLDEDHSLDDYLIGLMKQGNSLMAKDDDGSLAGFCVNFASSPVDATNLRNHAFYRQDHDIKDFLLFIAKLQETPNLWELYKQNKVFEVKMLSVLPKYRRQGLATTLVQKSRELARDQGYPVLRMDCLNEHDYKIAERCMLQCIAKFPLHKLRGPRAPFIKKHSEHNRRIRVYVDPHVMHDRDGDMPKVSELDLENTIE